MFCMSVCHVHAYWLSPSNWSELRVPHGCEELKPGASVLLTAEPFLKLKPLISGFQFSQ